MAEGSAKDTRGWIGSFEFAVRGSSAPAIVLMDGDAWDKLSRSLTRELSAEETCFTAFGGLDGNLYLLNRKHLLMWSFKYDVSATAKQLFELRGNLAEPPNSDYTEWQPPVSVETRFVDGQKCSSCLDDGDFPSLRTALYRLEVGDPVLSFDTTKGQVFLAVNSIAAISIPRWMLRIGLLDDMEVDAMTES